MNRPVVLDSNLLLLYIVGMHSPKTISKVKRLRAYSTSDFGILTEMLKMSRGIVLTPNSVTETSNLLRSGPLFPERDAITANLTSLLGRFGEEYVSSVKALERPEGSGLGVADSVMLIVAAAGAILLTADLDLYLAASRAGLEAINFNYSRDRQR